jgi:hypothetical protein
MRVKNDSEQSGHPLIVTIEGHDFEGPLVVSGNARFQRNEWKGTDPGYPLFVLGASRRRQTLASGRNHLPLISLSASCACHREGPEHPKNFSRISSGGIGGDGAPNSNTTPAS